MTRLFIFLFLSSFAVSCGSPGLFANQDTLFSDKGEESEIPKSELQSRVQRFAGVFNDRVNQAIQQMNTNVSQDVETLLLSRLLSYTSSAVDIAAGPTPEVNLLDMVVFVTLARDRVERYWIPRIYGKRGEILLEELKKSEKEIWASLALVSTAEQQRELRKIITRWSEENPDQVLIERVRLAEIASVEGEASEQRAEKLEGAFTTIKGAVSTADQTVLLANRAIFLAQNYPKIIRLQARIGTTQTLGDSLKILAGPEAEEFADTASPLVKNMGDLADETAKAAIEIRQLLETYQKAFPKDESSKKDSGASMMAKMERANKVIKNLTQLTSNLSGTGMQAQEALESSTEEVQDLIWQIALAGIAFMLVASGAWWGGYYFAKGRKLKNKSEA